MSRTIFLLLVCACSRPTERLAPRFFALAEEHGASLGALSGPSSRQRLEALAEQLSANTPQALGELLFDTGGFEREVDRDAAEFLLLPSVLASRRGSCVGLGQVALVVAERKQIQAHGVLVPGHFFIRVGDANLELLRRGELMPSSWYRQRFSVPAGVDYYMRALTDDEVVGVVHFNLGNLYREQGDLEAALHQYNRAIALFDQLAEAHASRGLVLQILKQLEAAERSYQRAAGHNPTLDGLEQNRRELERALE